jgi:hypothetical protein
MCVFIQSTKARMRGVMRRAWAKTIWIGIGGGSKSGSTMKACCPISKQSSTYAVPSPSWQRYKPISSSWASRRTRFTASPSDRHDEVGQTTERFFVVVGDADAYAILIRYGLPTKSSTAAMYSLE